MPAPIFERVAEKLGLLPDRSETLVRAMIREIRKRADQGQGVRVPNLGSFAVENGRLTFTPEPSLARSVNQRFEGLSEETVALPEVEESAQAGEGPTTITRGFDMGAWDPLDTGGTASNSGQSQSSNGGPDTDEFNAPPDTDEFQAPDTDEFQAPDTGEFDAASETAREQAESGPEPVPADTESSSSSDEEQASWDVGSAQPVSDASEDTRSRETASGDATTDGSGDDSFSPARFRGEDPSGTDEPEIDASAPLQVSDHRQSEPDDDGSYDGSGFQTASGDTDDGVAQDMADRDSVPETSSSERDDSRGEEEGDEPNIWASESVWDFSTVTSEDVEDEDDGFDFDDDKDGSDASSMTGDEDPSDGDEEPEYVSYRPPDADEQAEEERPSRSIFDFDSEDADEKKEAPRTTKLDASEIQNLDQERRQAANGEDDTSSRSAATTVTVVVLLILALIGGWIVLGQQGIVPPPSRTLGFSDGLTEATGTDATGGSETAPADGSTPTTGAADDATSNTSPAATPTPSDDSGSPSATNSGANDGASGNASTASRGFDRSAGGFTIAVASRESESQARALVDQFRRNLSDTNLRIDLVVGESGGTTRYRVGVGQFSTRAEANNMRNEMQSRLPNGAWPVPIE